MKRSILAFLALTALFAAVPVFADDAPLPEIPAVDEAPVPPLDAPAAE